MKKSNVIAISVSLSIFIFICSFYIWRFSPFLPHIDRNDDGSITYNNITYDEYHKIDMYSEIDGIEKFSHLKRGKKIAIINKQGDLPRCSVYEAQGDNHENVLIVYEEIIMSIYTYYVAK